MSTEEAPPRRSSRVGLVHGSRSGAPSEAPEADGILDKTIPDRKCEKAARREPPRGHLPIEKHAGLLAHDLGLVAGIDEEVFARGCLDGRAIVEDVADTTGDHVLAVVQRAALEVHRWLDVALPAPARLERREPNRRLVADPKSGPAQR